MAYDDVILLIGEFGRYQRRIYLLLCLPLFSCAFHTMAGVFLTAQADFRCLLPYEDPENTTYQLQPNITSGLYPWNDAAKDWSQCERYDVNLKDQFYKSDVNISSTNSVVKCDTFVYDETTYKLTVATEFNIICDKSWLINTANALYMVGMMLGSMTFGGLSDRYGRRPTLCLVLLIQAIGALLVAASPEIISYIILRMIVGATSSGGFMIIYVSALEMVLPDRRLMAMCLELAYTSGYILTTAFAYFITNWRFLQIAITIPNIAFLTYWWFIPESARWLVTTGRLDKAKDLLHGASLENNAELSRETLDTMLDNCSVSKLDLEESSVFDLFRYPNLRRRSLLLFLNSFVNNCTYYGLSWNTSSLEGNDYVNFAVTGLVEIPAILCVFFTLNKLGRKNILCTSMLLAGTALILTMFVSDDVAWLQVVLSMIGKLAITASYVTVNIFSAELYPTVIRNVGLGASSTCATMGGVLAPYINYSSIIWPHLPAVLFGTGSLIAGLSVLFLPETLNQKLPETIQDGEEFGK